MKCRSFLAALAVPAIVACSPPGTAEQQAESEESAVTSANSAPAAPPAADAGGSPAATDSGSATAAGDGSPIRLSPLTGADAEAANLSGELACSFASKSGQTLLLAKGDVASDERAFGVVKVADSGESISAPRGFDGMLKGATFVGKGKTIHIERSASKPVGGGESPPYPATLTYQRADGASRRFDGLWTCGP